MNEGPRWMGAALAAATLWFVSTVLGAAAPPPPPAPPRRVPARPARPAILPGELPPGEPTPKEQLPAQYFAGLGQLHMQHKQWPEAEAAYAEAYAREKQPSLRADIAYRLGQLHMRKKELDKALPLLEEAVKSAGSGARSYTARRYRLGLASIYEKQGQPEKAEALYEAWAKGTGSAYEKQMARRELLRLWQRSGKLDAAVARYEATLKEKPNDRETLDILRLIYTSVKPDAQKALALAESTVAAYPDDREAAMHLLSAYERVRNYDKAVPLLQKLMEKYPKESPMLSTRLVFLYIQAGQKDKAAELASGMLAKGPETSELHGRVASIYLQLGKVDEALGQYEAAAKLSKTPTERERYQLSAAHAARRSKEYAKAEGFIKELAKSKSKAIVAQAKRLLFEIYEEQNKLDQLEITPGTK